VEKIAQVFGISGVCNVLGEIKAAKCGSSPWFEMHALWQRGK